MDSQNLCLECRYNYNNTLLNDDEREFYVFVVKCLLNLQFSFIPPDKCNIDRIYKILEAIEEDFPEIFYLDLPGAFFDLGGIMKVSHMPYSRAEILAIWDKLDETLHRFDHISDPFLLELAVHDYIIESFDYEEKHKVMRGRKFRELFSIAAPLKRGKGVCAALTKIIQYVLTKRGIPVAYMVGYGYPAESIKNNPELLNDHLSAHAWLAIKLEDSYYHLDITANEGLSKEPDEPQYLSFNITDEELFQTTWYDTSAFPGIKCNDKKYNYYRHMNRIFDSHDEVVNAVCEFADLHKDSEKTPLYFAFQLRDGADDTDMPALTKILLKELRGKNITAFSMEGYESGHISIRLDKATPKTEKRDS